MLDQRLLRDNPDLISQQLARRGVQVDLSALQQMARQGRDLEEQRSNLQADGNRIGKEVGLKIKAGAFVIEGANPRHEHEWKVWKDVKLPAGKVLVPGVISHATNVVEHPELVAERIVRYANLVGRENVIASTDCGFAQGPFYRRVHPQIMWAKLQAMVDGAKLATKELWGTKKKAAKKPAAKATTTPEENRILEWESTHNPTASPAGTAKVVAPRLRSARACVA